MSKKNNRKAFARTDELYGLQPLSRHRWRQILVILGGVCLNCKGTPVTRDHIVPIARGGLNHPTNLQPLCQRCNLRKADSIFDYRTPEQKAQIAARWPLERIPLENYVEPIRTTLADLLS